MKKIFTLLTMMSMLALSSQAAYYLVGQAPFGNGWNTYTGVEMTLNADGLYSYKATINGAIYFVLADNLTTPEGVDDWTTFNGEYRIGPTGANETVGVDQWYTTQKAQGNGNGSYMFIGTGSEYTITYNPYISKFKIEGKQEIPPMESYTVAGTPAAVFGTEWDPANTDNDMTQQADGTYALTKYNCQLAGSELMFKVVGNHSWDSGFAWPSSDYVFTVDEPGLYDVTITFNPETEEVNATAEMSGSFDPRTGELYVLGELIEAAGWNPSDGLKMDTEDGTIFTTTFTSMGNNIDENDGIGYSFFNFTTKLSESADDWNSITAYRFGAIENDYLLSDDMMGIEIGLGNFGHAYSFKIPAGEYNMTVNLENMTMVINKAETPEPPAGPKIEKVWEIAGLDQVLPTADVRQGFGMNGKFYINNKSNTVDEDGNQVTVPTIVVVDENGISETTYPGGRNCGITRDEAGNIIISDAVFPGAWSEAVIKVLNPETGETKEYIVPEECGQQGRYDFLGFAKGNLMEDGALYISGGTTGTDPFTPGISVMTIAGGEVSTDDCFLATWDGFTSQTSTVINYYKDLNDEDAMVFAYRSGNPTKLTWDGEELVSTPIVLPGKGHCNGIFPFVWDGKEYFIYPTMPDYQNGFAIAESGAEEPLVEVPSTVAANANNYQADWFNAEVDKDGVTIYQYYPGGNVTVYRLTNESGGVEEIITDVDKVVSRVRYYNIMGQEMKEAHGLTIIVTTYTDGSHSAVKVIK